MFPDYQNAKLFEAKMDDQWKHYPAANRKNVKSDVVKLGKEYASGEFYIGIKNPDNMHGINVRLEVVAIVHEVEKAERTIKIPQVASSQVPYLKN